MRRERASERVAKLIRALARHVSIAQKQKSPLSAGFFALGDVISGRLLRRGLLHRRGSSGLFDGGLGCCGLLRHGAFLGGLVRARVAVAADGSLALAGLAVASAHISFSGKVVVVLKL